MSIVSTKSNQTKHMAKHTAIRVCPENCHAVLSKIGLISHKFRIKKEDKQLGLYRAN